MKKKGGVRDKGIKAARPFSLGGDEDKQIGQGMGLAISTLPMAIIRLVSGAYGRGRFVSHSAVD